MAQHDTATTPSADGTSIAFQRSGRGPALVFVDGAFCTRSMGPGKTLAPALEDRFTTYIYDRRGRGQSGDAEVYQPFVRSRTWLRSSTRPAEQHMSSGILQARC